jgi:hypothetical protein
VIKVFTQAKIGCLLKPQLKPNDLSFTSQKKQLAPQPIYVRKKGY